MSYVEPQVKAMKHSVGRNAIVLASVAAGVGLVALLIWATAIRWDIQSSPPTSDNLFQACLKDVSQVIDIRDAGSHCYKLVEAQLQLRDFEVRRQMFLTQQQEGLRINQVSMIILLIATTSGIVLSGLQMLASFRLMSKGYEQMETNTELVLKYNAVALRSSAVGVSIFAISMLFFAVLIYFNFHISVEEPHTVYQAATPAPIQIPNRNPNH